MGLYKLSLLKHVGLFKCKIFKEGINVNLLDLVYLNKTYNSTYRDGVNVENIEIHKIREESLKDLELAYSSNDKIITS